MQRYINEYRNTQCLTGHAGYFLTSLESAMMFWLDCDHTMLNMDETTFNQMINFEDVFGKETSEEKQHKKPEITIEGSTPISPPITEQSGEQIQEVLQPSIEITNKQQPSELTKDGTDQLETPPTSLAQENDQAQQPVNNNEPTEEPANEGKTTSNLEENLIKVTNWNNLVTLMNSLEIQSPSFEQASWDDLRVKDIAQLHKEYKEMATLFTFIKKQLNN